MSVRHGSHEDDATVGTTVIKLDARRTNALSVWILTAYQCGEDLAIDARNRRLSVADARRRLQLMEAATDVLEALQEQEPGAGRLVVRPSMLPLFDYIEQEARQTIKDTTPCDGDGQLQALVDMDLDALAISRAALKT